MEVELTSMENITKHFGRIFIKKREKEKAESEYTKWWGTRRGG